MTTGSEGTEAAAAASGQPEATDRTGTVAGSAAIHADVETTTNGNASNGTPGLDSLPGELRETLKDLPPHTWPAHVAVYRSMQSQKDRAIQETANERKRLETMARNGETMERISKHPKAKELLWEAGKLASRDPDAEVVDDAALGEDLLADNDPEKFGRKFRTAVRSEAQRIVEQTFAQRDAVARQADDALTGAFADVQARSGLSPEQWASVAAKAWKEEGGRAAFTPENVATLMLPYILSATRAPSAGNPQPQARAAKAASLMGQNGSVQPADDVPAWVGKRPPTRAEGVAYMLKITGAKSPKDFMAAWHGTIRG